MEASRAGQVYRRCCSDNPGGRFLVPGGQRSIDSRGVGTLLIFVELKQYSRSVRARQAGCDTGEPEPAFETMPQPPGLNAFI